MNTSPDAPHREPSDVPAAPPGSANGEQPAEGPKAKLVAPVRSVAALAGKVGKAVAGRGASGGRAVAGRARTMREQRVARRCVIVTESGGRQVVIGPYRDEEAARKDLARVPAGAGVAQLKAASAYFADVEAGPTAGPSSTATP